MVIYKALVFTDCHPTPEAIYEQVKRGIPAISLGTVYKNIHPGGWQINLLGLDRSAYSTPARATFGNLARNMQPGFGVNNWDFSAIKNSVPWPGGVRRTPGAGNVRHRHLRCRPTHLADRGQAVLVALASLRPATRAANC
jgi:hypothetical protein